MDTATEDLTRADSKAAELKAQIKEQEAKKKSLQDQIKDIEKQRVKENAAFKADKLADQQAVSLINSAIGFLKDWKSAKKAALITQHKMDVVEGALDTMSKAET